MARTRGCKGYNSCDPGLSSFSDGDVARIIFDGRSLEAEERVPGMWDIWQCFLCKERRLHICLLFSSAVAEGDRCSFMAEDMTSGSPLPLHQVPVRISPCFAQRYRARNIRQKHHEGSVRASQSVHVRMKPPRVTTTRRWRKLSPSVGQPNPPPNSACPDHPLKVDLGKDKGQPEESLVSLSAWQLFFQLRIGLTKDVMSLSKPSWATLARVGTWGGWRACTKASATTTQPSMSWLGCSVRNNLKV